MEFKRPEEDIDSEDDSETDEIARTYSCRECGATFNSSFDFEVHLNKGHANVAKQIHCSTCGQTFKSQNGLESHACHFFQNTTFDHTAGTQISRKNSDKVSECHLCGRHVKYLGQHLTRFHKQGLNSKADLIKQRPQRNAIEDSNRTFQCSECPKAFTRRMEVERHEYEVHFSKDQFPCEVCDRNFKAKRYLRDHMRRVHKQKLKASYEPKVNQSFNCTFCDKSLASESSLQRHIQVVHKKDQVCKCDVCGATFARLRSLTQHKERVHDTEMEQGITMDIKAPASNSSWNKVFARNVKAEIELVKAKSEFPADSVIFEDSSSRDSLKSEPFLRKSFESVKFAPIPSIQQNFQLPENKATFKCVHCDYKAYTQMDIIKHNIFQHTQ